MMKLLCVPALAALCLACADGEVDPRPSSEDLDLLLASLEAPPPERQAIDPEERAKAERLLPAIEKMQPEKINPAVAGAFLAR